MQCEMPWSDGRASDRMDRFLEDPEVRVVTGTRRVDKSILLDTVEQGIGLTDPGDHVIRAYASDLEDAAAFLDAHLKKGVRNHVLTDLAEGFSEFTEAAASAVSKGYDVTVYHAVELCHQLPACEKIRPMKG